ncbi:hypothetical protein CUZ56_01748 [Saezia sanguinis]|uniref:Lipoprotein n=1 Tax=Saezia sanguinis TaxID=1965230 RepID=A0A433SCJ2_9BURK|nr:hypothetical protein CUZ56_01748 [Saezia sanguinis]
MKKTLLFLFISLMLSGCTSQIGVSNGWQKIHENEKLSFYIENPLNTNIENWRGEVSGDWTFFYLLVQGKDNEDPWSMVIDSAVNCSSQTFLCRYIVRYDQPFGKGNITQQLISRNYSTCERNNTFPVPQIINFICQ